MSDWIKVEDDMPPFAGYHDATTERVLVIVKQDYGPGYYIGYADYGDGDGVVWCVEGLSHPSRPWKVTHWRKLPDRPKEEM